MVILLSTSVMRLWMQHHSLIAPLWETLLYSLRYWQRDKINPQGRKISTSYVSVIPMLHLSVLIYVFKLYPRSLVIVRWIFLECNENTVNATIVIWQWCDITCKAIVLDFACHPKSWYRNHSVLEMGCICMKRFVFCWVPRQNCSYVLGWTAVSVFLSWWPSWNVMTSSCYTCLLSMVPLVVGQCIPRRSSEGSQICWCYL